MMLSSRNSSLTAGHSPSTSHYLGSPLYQDESFIEKMDEVNETSKMNDSLLSIYNELDIEGKIKEEVKKLKEEVVRLTRLVEEFKKYEAGYLSRLEYADSLQ